MSNRIACCVPFCRRTAKREAFTEIICGKCWRKAPKARRQVYSRLLRRYRRRFGNNCFWTYPPGSAERLECVALTRRCDVIWAAIKKRVIERAAGL